MIFESTRPWSTFWLIDHYLDGGAQITAIDPAGIRQLVPTSGRLSS
jgi:hypothetical protein